MVNFVLIWAQLLLMPLSCIPKKWRDLITETCFYCLIIVVQNGCCKKLFPQVWKMSTQWYICNDEVRNLRITSSPKIHGLFHSSTDGIFHFLQWSVTTLTPLVCIYRSVMCQPRQVQPQTKWVFLQRTVCFYSDHALMWT